jgi:hypothetical protein
MQSSRSLPDALMGLNTDASLKLAAVMKMKKLPREICTARACGDST